MVGGVSKAGKFPGGPVRTQCFHCHGLASITGQGTKILQVGSRAKGGKKKKRLRPDLKGWSARHKKLDGKIKGNSNVTLEDH